MPIDSKILGFSNQWYRDAMKASGTFMLPAGIVIRTTTAPYFIATKLEAFKSRGKRDFLGSHDLEDILTVVDGRATLADEVRAQSQEIRAYVGREIGPLLGTPAFLDALPGHLFPDAASQARIHLILERLGALAAIK